jgi:hypothetical protein
MNHVCDVSDFWEFAAWFWDQVDERDEEECWPWLGSTVDGGYGRVTWEGLWFGAHCVAYELANTCKRWGHILHYCDNPRCCNPVHLREGTNAENVEDRMMAGRDANRVGELNGRHRLTRGEVSKIRGMFARQKAILAKDPTAPRRLTYRAVAKKYGVCPSTIQHVVQRRNWKPATRQTGALEHAKAAKQHV